jgi:hypothetical protein
LAVPEVEVGGAFRDEQEVVGAAIEAERDGEEASVLEVGDGTGGEGEL